MTLVLRLVQCWAVALAATGGLLATTIGGQSAWTSLHRRRAASRRRSM